MYQAEQQERNGGDPGPALIGQQGLQGGQAGIIHQASRGQIGHQQDRDHDFIGGERQDKGQQDHPVQPQQLAQRIQEIRAELQQGLIAGMQVGQQPEQDTGRCGYCCRPSQDKEGAVKQGPDQNPADLRAAVRRKLQRKGRGHPF